MIDVLGQTLHVGDRIALAMRQGNTAGIRVGIIRAIRYTMADVEWEAVGISYTRPNAKVTEVSLPQSRVVKISCLV